MLAFRALKTLLIFLLTIGSLAAQEGGYFLSHHAPDKNFDEVNFDIIQDPSGVIYVANRAGIVVFDGKRWDFLQTSAAIFSLAADNDNTIYTGGRNGFGQIRKDGFFKLAHSNLSDSSYVNSDIFSVLYHDNNLYGISEERVFIHNLNTNASTSIKPKRNGYFLDIFLFKESVYVANTVSGVQEVGEEGLITPSHEALNSQMVNTVASTADREALFFEQEDGSLWRLSEQELKPIPLEVDDQLFLRENQIQQIIWLGNDLIAVSTLRGGIVFLNGDSGKFLQVIDGQNGLPTDEIYTINVDRERNLWVSHAKGFTRISPTAPLRSFSEYPGLEGELLTSTMHNNQLYVGTTNGLYTLSAVREYKSEEYFESRQVVQEIQNQTSNPAGSVERKRRGLFGFLKKKQSETSAPVSPSTPSTQIVRKTLVERKTREKLHSVHYEYVKIQGLHSRVTELFSTGERLMAAGLDGFFQIIDNQSQLIIDEPVRSYYYSSHYGAAFIGTINNEIRIFDLRAEVQELYLFGDYSNYTTHIFEDPENRIWLCGTSKMIWLTMDDQEMDDTGEVAFENPYFYDTYGSSKEGGIYFLNAAGEYLLEQDLVKKVGGPRKIVKGSNGQLWTLGKMGWTSFSEEQAEQPFDLLNVFRDPQFLTQQEDQLWLISSNSLLRLNSSPEKALGAAYNLLLRGVKTDSSNIQSSGKLLIDQDKSAIQFEYVKPEYTGIMNIQYQYKLGGLAASKWTDWSVDFSTITFPYLPEGDYELNVRAKDSFGVIADAEVIKFKVVPPYWKRPWFYALEFTALGLLLVISLRIKRLGYRYRLGSRLLALLTLIIIIEFIQTIAENEFQTKSSAIFDFTIQVLMAIIILPLEGLLRKYIFKEKNVQLLDFFRIKGKEKTNEN